MLLPLCCHYLLLPPFSTCYSTSLPLYSSWFELYAATPMSLTHITSHHDPKVFVHVTNSMAFGSIADVIVLVTKSNIIPHHYTVLLPSTSQTLLYAKGSPPSPPLCAISPPPSICRPRRSSRHAPQCTASPSRCSPWRSASPGHCPSPSSSHASRNQTATISLTLLR